MSVEIIVAIITSVFTFLGVVFSVRAGNKKTAKEVKGQTDLTIYRINELEKKQNVHNNLIERTFRLEGKVEELQHDVRDLKSFHGIGVKQD